MNKQNIIDELNKVLIESYGVPLKKALPSTRINKDLGIEGDDALELISTLEKSFHLDIAICFSDFFIGEGLFAGGKRNDLSIDLFADLILSSTPK